MAIEKKKPITKGKNRLFIGTSFGIDRSPKIVKTWEKGWRKAWQIGPKAKL